MAAWLSMAAAGKGPGSGWLTSAGLAGAVIASAGALVALTVWTETGVSAAGGAGGTGATTG